MLGVPFACQGFEARSSGRILACAIAEVPLTCLLASVIAFSVPLQALGAFNDALTLARRLGDRSREFSLLQEISSLQVQRRQLEKASMLSVHDMQRLSKQHVLCAFELLRFVHGQHVHSVRLALRVCVCSYPAVH